MRKLLIAIVSFAFLIGAVYATEDAWSIAGYSLGQKVDTNGWKKTPSAALVKKTCSLSQKFLGCYDQLGLIADKDGKIKLIMVYVVYHTEQEKDQACMNAAEWLFTIYKSNPRYQEQKGHNTIRIVDSYNSRFIEWSLGTLSGHKFVMIKIASEIFFTK